MKISIITLHYITHYGSLLQTYATCKMFEKLGYQAEVVDYVRPNAESKIQIKQAVINKGYEKKRIKKWIFIVVKSFENKMRDRFSHKFLEKYVPMTRRFKDYTDLSQNCPEADIYCTGSDQTWNSEYNGGVLPAYYLDFAPEGKKRIGYAVSIGMNQFPAEEYAQTKDFIMKYDAISVREDSAKRLLQELGYDKVQQILDPTLGLSLEDWRPLISARMLKDKYVVVYKLNDNPELEKFAENLAKKNGYKLVRMSYYLNHFREKGKMFFSPDVGEFLSLIYYAEHVVTDSFHCVAFSLNFGKDFVAFYPGKYSTRISSILELTGTQHRAAKTDTFLMKKIDYDYVNRVLQLERKKIIKFIQENC